MKQPIVVFVLVILCLSLGVFIYAFTRSEDIYLNQWIAHIGDGKIFIFLQNFIPNSALPDWIVYSLPDSLWMVALTILILLIWDFKLHRKSITWIALAIAAGILFEILQGFHVVNGTFDIRDLLMIILGASLPIIFTSLKLKSCKIN